MLNAQTFSPAPEETSSPLAPSWTFLTNHAHVLLSIAANPEIRLRDVASRVGITERAVQKIVADLEVSGYLTRSRVGRCNTYKVHAHQPLRHPIEKHRPIGALLALVAEPKPSNS